jgi:hypothetical protein
MAFVNTLFPTTNLRLIHGLRKTISAPTTIVGNGNSEYRIKKLKNFISSWVYPARILSSVDRKAIALFFTDVAQFGLNSFKYQDPDLCTWVNTPLTYSGADNKFYLTTRGSADTHPVFHLGGDIVVKASGTPVSYTQAYTNNVPTIIVAGATSGITISGTFYHCARFDQASMSWSSEVLNSDNSNYGDNLGDISLVEVFEH